MQRVVGRAERPAPTRATVIAVAAHKGGVGKTVTATSLAAAFACEGDRTLLIDVDPQGHSTLGLGVEVGLESNTVLNLFAEPTVPASEVVCATSRDRLDIMPATIRLERVAQWLYMRPKREQMLMTALEPLRTRYRWIVIDCPPSLGALTEGAVMAADLVLVPCRYEARAADGLVDLLELVGLLRGDAYDGWRLLRTQLDARTQVTNQAVEAALEPWRPFWFDTVVPKVESLNQAQIERVDIFKFDPKSRGALAYAALAREVRGVLCPVSEIV